MENNLFAPDIQISLRPYELKFIIEIVEASIRMMSEKGRLTKNQQSFLDKLKYFYASTNQK